jgi:hypothetical protein
MSRDWASQPYQPEDSGRAVEPFPTPGAVKLAPMESSGRSHIYDQLQEFGSSMCVLHPPKNFPKEPFNFV